MCVRHNTPFIIHSIFCFCFIVFLFLSLSLSLFLFLFLCFFLSFFLSLFLLLCLPLSLFLSLLSTIDPRFSSPSHLLCSYLIYLLLFFLIMLPFTLITITTIIPQLLCFSRLISSNRVRGCQQRRNITASALGFTHIINIQRRHSSTKCA